MLPSISRWYVVERSRPAAAASCGQVAGSNRLVALEKQYARSSAQVQFLAAVYPQGRDGMPVLAATAGINSEQL